MIPSTEVHGNFQSVKSKGQGTGEATYLRTSRVFSYCVIEFLGMFFQGDPNKCQPEPNSCFALGDKIPQRKRKLEATAC